MIDNFFPQVINVRICEDYYLNSTSSWWWKFSTNKSLWVSFIIMVSAHLYNVFCMHVLTSLTVFGHCGQCCKYICQVFNSLVQPHTGLLLRFYCLQFLSLFSQRTDLNQIYCNSYIQHFSRIIFKLSKSWYSMLPLPEIMVLLWLYAYVIMNTRYFLKFLVPSWWK